MLTRYPDWTERLEKFLAESRLNRFSYGYWDCCTFIADAISAMTGTDLAQQYRERYSSRAQALSVASELAGSPSIQTVAESCTAAHGMAEIPVLRAFRGDMVLLARQPRQNGLPRDFSMGIVAMDGQHILIAGRRGWGMVPLDRGCRAWRV